MDVWFYLLAEDVLGPAGGSLRAPVLRGWGRCRLHRPGAKNAGWPELRGGADVFVDAPGDVIAAWDECVEQPQAVVQYDRAVTARRAGVVAES